jgi:pimeloyl-ACP methyl ester carboxylesterase
MRAPDRYLDHLARQMAPADRPILARPAVRAMFAEDYRAAFAQGMDAFAADLAIMASPWGFTPAAAPGPIALWHGEADRMVPPSAARTIAAGVPAAELRVQAGDGHFMVFDRWAEILDWLAGE